VSDPRDALLFLELDKGGDAPGPLFEEPRRMLERDPRLRAGWQQYQALKALALEASPEPSEKMLRAVLLQCRRERVGRQLARATGDDELARSILLGKAPGGRSFPGWLKGLLAFAALAMGAMAVWGYWLGLDRKAPGNAPPAPALTTGKEEAVPFEFPLQTPADAALSQPSKADQGNDAQSDADDTHSEPAAARQARRILREHLHEAVARERSDEGDNTAQDDTPTPPPTPTPLVRRALVAQPVGLPASTPRPWPTAYPALMNAGAAQAMGLAPVQAPLPAPALAPVQAPLPAPALAPTQVAAPAPTRVATPWAAPTAAPASPTAGPGPAPAGNLDAIQGSPAGLTLSSGSLTVDGSLDITLGLPERKDIDLRLFDMEGHSVRLLAQGAFGPGIQHFPLDARGDTGGALAPGNYYLRVMTPWFSRVEPIAIQNQ